MISYKDRTFCSAKDCLIEECARHQNTINKDHLERSGLPLSISECYKVCKEYKPSYKGDKGGTP